MTLGLNGKLCIHCGCPCVVDHGSPEECVKVLRHENDVLRVAKKAAAIEVFVDAAKIAPLLTAAVDEVRRQLVSPLANVIIMANGYAKTADGSLGVAHYTVYRGDPVGVLGLLTMGTETIRQQTLPKPSMPASVPAIERP